MVKGWFRFGRKKLECSKKSAFSAAASGIHDAVMVECRPCLWILKNPAVTNDAQISLMADIKAAGTVIRQAITDADGPLPPHFLVEFLLSQWRRYLVLTHHHQGARSLEWAAAVDVTRRLLLSILPVTTLEQRSNLAKSVPALIADLKRGASNGHIDSLALNLFLKQLSELHFAKLDPKRPLEKPLQNDLSDTISMDVRDPRYRALLDQLDGAVGVEHIEM